MPGARELMEDLDRHGVPCAIVTASFSIIMDAVRTRLPHSVRYIVTSDLVANAKRSASGVTLAQVLDDLRAVALRLSREGYPGPAAKAPR